MGCKEKGREEAKSKLTSDGEPHLRAESRTQDLTPPGYSNQLTPWLSLTEAGIDRMMRSVSLEYPTRLLLERSR